MENYMETHKWTRILFILLIVRSADLLQSATDLSDNLTDDGDKLPVGDPRRCARTDKSRPMLRFEVLPGGGWDNLQNKEMGVVISQNYSKCLTTDDGKYLIPDGIYTVPMKNSEVETFAELIEHWDSYTSTLSRSINVEAGLNLPHFGINAKFSSEYENIKSHQHNDKSMTTRIQARYVRYQAKLQPDTAVNSAFKNRLRKIAVHIALNRTELARYESQLLVRDFGTHVVTGVDAGAALVLVEHLKSTYIKDSQSETNKILAAASANFFGIFHFGTSFSQKTTSSEMQTYLDQRTHSRVMTFGGPVYRPLNYSADQWSDLVDNDLVSLDKSGDPIYFIITEAVLPEIPPSIVFNVYNYVKDAVTMYYKHNTIRGCTKPDSPSFNFQANVEDGSCMPQKTNFSFGGVYQVCEGGGYTDLCSGMRQKNPATGNYNCSQDYEPITIQTGSKSVSVSRHECHRCGWWRHCCRDNTYWASATYTAFWCAAKGQISKNSGYLFGGLFTRTTINPLTQTRNCPLEFYQLTILDGLVICVSDDYELGYQYSLPFAGFYSCIAGNPLSMKEKSQLQKSSGITNTLHDFMMSSGFKAYPHSCPDGYSQHLAVVDNGCEINYCVKFGTLSAQGLPKLLRPPFMDAPNDGNSNNSYVVSNDGSMFLNMEEDSKVIPQNVLNNDKESNRDHAEKNLGPGVIAAITVSVTLVCLIIAIIIVVKIKRHRNEYHRVFEWDDPTDERRHIFTSDTVVKST